MQNWTIEDITFFLQSYGEYKIAKKLDKIHLMDAAIKKMEGIVNKYSG